ncbi:hypothetical protein M426DRAFT_247424 [Hypoxylon sp. CI-4A]|nr:hypothetical protein M426DRAFT_247424 [Hypoxylon sp. CI-4A]
MWSTSRRPKESVWKYERIRAPLALGWQNVVVHQNCASQGAKEAFQSRMHLLVCGILALVFYPSNSRHANSLMLLQ